MTADSSQEPGSNQDFAPPMADEEAPPEGLPEISAGGALPKARFYAI